jgi:ABC-2 type transport system ATP-binding protein
MSSIESSALSKRFGDLVAVDAVDLEIAEGESFALLGPNGAGKSTLIRLLTTLLRPTSGKARVAGHDVVEDPGGVRKSIGVVPQAMTCDPRLTAGENVDFYARLHNVPRDERIILVEELLGWVDLLEWRDKYVGTFSGGMRRRVEIARSLVHRPQILFLDEPTTGLDPASRTAMWKMLRKMRREHSITIFLTTHYMEEAEQFCDRVAIFDEGRIVALGSPRELISMLPVPDSIEVAFAACPEGWEEILSRLHGVESVRQEGATWSLGCRDREKTLSALIDASRKHELEIQELRITQPTLQDVFIHLTGRGLRDNAATRIAFDRRLLHGD